MRASSEGVYKLLATMLDKSEGVDFDFLVDKFLDKFFHSPCSSKG